MTALMYTVVLLGAVQGAVLSAILARRQQNPLASRILSVLVASLALMLILGYLDMRWGFAGYPHLIALGTPLPFVFAPLLYLYVEALTSPLQRLRARALVHALPFLANCIFMAEAFYFKSGAEKLDIAERFLSGEIPTAVRVFQAIMVVQSVAYLAACFWALRRYGERIRTFFSDLHRIDLRWLMVLVIGNSLVWALVAVATALQLLSLGIDLVDLLRPMVQLGSAAMIFLIGYISLWQPDLFDQARLARPSSQPPNEATNAEPATEPLVETPPRRASYQRNPLEPGEADTIASELQTLVGTQELFRDPGLTLQTLADALAVPRHTLSQVLNTHIGKSFYAFVNMHRAEALKTALRSPALRERGVLDLALEAGFNSKSTANSVFKGHTGLTPSQYRSRSLLKDAPDSQQTTQ